MGKSKRTISLPPLIFFLKLGDCIHFFIFFMSDSDIVSILFLGWKYDKRVKDFLVFDS